MKVEDLVALGVDEEVAKQISARHEQDTQGLTNKRDELLSKLSDKKSENAELSAFKQEIAPLMRYMQGLQENDQESQYAELLKAGKIDELLEAKTKPIQHQLTELNKLLETAKQNEASAVNKYNNTLIENAMNAALSESKTFIPEAANIAKLHANNFEVNEGAVFTKDGKPVADWINSDFKESNPFLVAQGQGSGATGSSGKVVTNKKINEMSEAERVYLYRNDPAAFAKLKET